MPFLEVDQVSKHYRAGGDAPLKALDNVSFNADAGEWIAIMGPSGSGKTTLLNILGCLDQPTSGSVRIASTDISKLSRGDLVRFRAETVGLIFQQYHLIPHLTALENVMLAQYFHSMADENEARRALEHVGLGERAGHLPSQLSGGEQQRVAIARALANDPKIILADEPTGNLDAANEQTVIDLLSELHAQGRTILLVTHDERVGRCADRRINLEHGRIAETVVFTAEENEDFDEILEELWMRRETAMHHESLHFTEVQRRKLFSTMSRIGLLRVAGDQIRFTDEGEERARSVIRRHRLAERLFMDVLFIRDDAAVETNACTFEHILSPEVTDRICTFLGHPKTCPHGSPIPPGECCANGAHSTVEHPARATLKVPSFPK
ncbi:MAG TPA: ATP-binding cassette domain-containing protein [Bryobacteraceae bacterium]|nr:ATP-binding cassette domain-containing protein [Bryobacteraceae bacterium]